VPRRSAPQLGDDTPGQPVAGVHVDTVGLELALNRANSAEADRSMCGRSRSDRGQWREEEICMSPIAVIEAPSILGLRPTGVDTLPEALLQAGLIGRLHARHAGRVVPESAYSATRDTTTLTLNAPGVASSSRKLGETVGKTV
jgi:hypothetical protein